MNDDKLQVSRDGKQLGSFTPEEILKGLESGRLLETDYFYQNEHDRWVKLSLQFCQTRKTEDTDYISLDGLPKPTEEADYSVHTNNFACQSCLCRFDTPAHPTLSTTKIGLLSLVGILLLIPNGKYWNYFGLLLIAYNIALCVTDSLSYPRCPTCRSPNFKNLRE